MKAHFPASFIIISKLWTHDGNNFANWNSDLVSDKTYAKFMLSAPLNLPHTNVQQNKK